MITFELLRDSRGIPYLHVRLWRWWFDLYRNIRRWRTAILPRPTEGR